MLRTDWVEEALRGMLLRNATTGRIGEADRVSEGLDDEDVGTRTPQRGRVTRCRSLEGNEVYVGRDERALGGRDRMMS